MATWIFEYADGPENPGQIRNDILGYKAMAAFVNPEKREGKDINILDVKGRPNQSQSAPEWLWLKPSFYMH